MERQVRTVYLYLFALLGLVFMSIGGIRLTDLALRTFVFRTADREERHRMAMPPMPPPVRSVDVSGQSAALTEADRQMLEQWRTDYERWQEEGSRIDPVRARRDRTAASSLAMILIGLPMYLYHYRRIRAELDPARA